MPYTVKLVLLSLILLFVTGKGVLAYTVAASLLWLYIRSIYGIITGR